MGLPAILGRLLARLPAGSGRRPPDPNPGPGAGGLDAAALRDLGLTPGDRLAIARGLFFHDDSRRQR